MKDLQKLFNECIAELDAIGVEYGNITSVKVNTRAQKRWGLCKKKLITDCENSAQAYEYEISISHRLLADDVNDKVVKDTIMHEILHTCKKCYAHNNVWKSLANKVNKAYGYNIKRTTSCEEKEIESNIKDIAKHKFVCVCCGTEVFRLKESNFTRNYKAYRCTRCGGNFKKEY